MERRRVRARESYARHREAYLPRKRAAGLRSKYGLTQPEIDALFERASGRCEICRVSGRRLNIDHDHATGKVRGLLCSGCNPALHWAEQPDWLEAAKAYLQDRS